MFHVKRPHRAPVGFGWRSGPAPSFSNRRHSSASPVPLYCPPSGYVGIGQASHSLPVVLGRPTRGTRRGFPFRPTQPAVPPRPGITLPVPVLLVHRLCSRPAEPAIHHPLLARTVRTMSTTVVGGSTIPIPHRRTVIGVPPSRAITALVRTTSSTAVVPLTANNRPPGRTSGRHQRANRSNGATARAVTTSAPPTRATVADSSARPRTMVRLARFNASRHSSRKRIRRAIGSTRLIRRSGLTLASTIPGSPAPEPTSTTARPGSSSSSRATQFSRCRSQSRGTSRGPMRPRSTPSVARSSA